MRRVYAVKKGRETGVFESWGEVKQLVEGFPGAEHKSFPSRREAEEYLGPSLSSTSSPQTREQEPSPEKQSKRGSNLEYEGYRSNATHRVEFDGVSKQNPGIAGSGAVVINMATNQEVATVVTPLEYGSTNNEAEYCGLINGLAKALELGVKCVVVQGDSKLVLHQVHGSWKVSAPHLKSYQEQARKLVDQFEECEFKFLGNSTRSPTGCQMKLSLWLIRDQEASESKGCMYGKLPIKGFGFTIQLVSVGTDPTGPPYVI
jgi:ribonuclease HI